MEEGGTNPTRQHLVYYFLHDEWRTTTTQAMHNINTLCCWTTEIRQNILHFETTGRIEEEHGHDSGSGRYQYLNSSIFYSTVNSFFSVALAISARRPIDLSAKKRILLHNKKLSQPPRFSHGNHYLVHRDINFFCNLHTCSYMVRNPLGENRY